jgi:hypothetical protein
LSTAALFAYRNYYHYCKPKVFTGDHSARKYIDEKHDGHVTNFKPEFLLLDATNNTNMSIITFIYNWELDSGMNECLNNRRNKYPLQS